jgi:hypothetical protein
VTDSARQPSKMSKTKKEENNLVLLGPVHQLASNSVDQGNLADERRRRHTSDRNAAASSTPPSPHQHRSCLRQTSDQGRSRLIPSAAATPAIAAASATRPGTSSPPHQRSLPPHRAGTPPPYPLATPPPAPFTPPSRLPASDAIATLIGLECASIDSDIRPPWKTVHDRLLLQAHMI